jgi:hypothetical protein
MHNSPSPGCTSPRPNIANLFFFVALSFLKKKTSNDLGVYLYELGLSYHQQLGGNWVAERAQPATICARHLGPMVHGESKSALEFNPPRSLTLTTNQPPIYFSRNKSAILTNQTTVSTKSSTILSQKLEANPRRLCCCDLSQPAL